MKGHDSTAAFPAADAAISPVEMFAALEPPLDELCRMGRPCCDGWPRNEGRSYPDLTEEHIPQLIEIARLWGSEVWEAFPEEDSIDVWTPLHAWRALGELRAHEAIDPLIKMLPRLDAEEDDWYIEELPRVFAMIGPRAFDPLVSYMMDEAMSESMRVAASSGLRWLANEHAEMRDAVVAALATALEAAVENPPAVNGLVICQLLDLNAVEAAEAVERAFATNNVDELCCGPWRDVRRELGVEGMGLVPDRDMDPKWQPWEAARLRRIALQQKAEARQLDREKSRIQARRRRERQERKRNRKLKRP